MVVKKKEKSENLETGNNVLDFQADQIIINLGNSGIGFGFTKETDWVLGIQGVTAFKYAPVSIELMLQRKDDIEKLMLRIIEEGPEAIKHLRQEDREEIVPMDYTSSKNTMAYVNCFGRPSSGSKNPNFDFNSIRPPPDDETSDGESESDMDSGADGDGRTASRGGEGKAPGDFLANIVLGEDHGDPKGASMRKKLLAKVADAGEGSSRPASKENAVRDKKGRVKLATLLNKLKMKATFLQDMAHDAREFSLHVEKKLRQEWTKEFAYGVVKGSDVVSNLQQGGRVSTLRVSNAMALTLSSDEDGGPAIRKSINKSMAKSPKSQPKTTLKKRLSQAVDDDLDENDRSPPLRPVEEHILQPVRQNLWSTSRPPVSNADYNILSKIANDQRNMMSTQLGSYERINLKNLAGLNFAQQENPRQHMMETVVGYCDAATVRGGTPSNGDLDQWTRSIMRWKGGMDIQGNLVLHPSDKKQMGSDSLDLAGLTGFSKKSEAMEVLNKCLDRELPYYSLGCDGLKPLLPKPTQKALAKKALLDIGNPNIPEGVNPHKEIVDPKPKRVSRNKSERKPGRRRSVGGKSEMDSPKADGGGTATMCGAELQREEISAQQLSALRGMHIATVINAEAAKTDRNINLANLVDEEHIPNVHQLEIFMKNDNPRSLLKDVRSQLIPRYDNIVKTELTKALEDRSILTNEAAQTAERMIKEDRESYYIEQERLAREREERLEAEKLAEEAARAEEEVAKKNKRPDADDEDEIIKKRASATCKKAKGQPGPDPDRIRLGLVVPLPIRDNDMSEMETCEPSSGTDAASVTGTDRELVKGTKTTIDKTATDSERQPSAGGSRQVTARTVESRGSQDFPAGLSVSLNEGFALPENEKDKNFFPNYKLLKKGDYMHMITVQAQLLKEQDKPWESWVMKQNGSGVLQPRWEMAASSYLGKKIKDKRERLVDTREERAQNMRNQVLQRAGIGSENGGYNLNDAIELIRDPFTRATIAGVMQDRKAWITEVGEFEEFINAHPEFLTQERERAMQSSVRRFRRRDSATMLSRLDRSPSILEPNPEALGGGNGNKRRSVQLSAQENARLDVLMRAARKDPETAKGKVEVMRAATGPRAVESSRSYSASASPTSKAGGTRSSLTTLPDMMTTGMTSAESMQTAIAQATVRASFMTPDVKQGRIYDDDAGGSMFSNLKTTLYTRYAKSQGASPQDSLSPMGYSKSASPYSRGNARRYTVASRNKAIDSEELPEMLPPAIPEELEARWMHSPARNLDVPNIVPGMAMTSLTHFSLSSVRKPQEVDNMPRRWQSEYAEMSRAEMVNKLAESTREKSIARASLLSKAIGPHSPCQQSPANNLVEGVEEQVSPHDTRATEVPDSAPNLGVSTKSGTGGGVVKFKDEDEVQEIEHVSSHQRTDLTISTSSPLSAATTSISIMSPSVDGGGTERSESDPGLTFAAATSQAQDSTMQTRAAENLKRATRGVGGSDTSQQGRKSNRTTRQIRATQQLRQTEGGTRLVSPELMRDILRDDEFTTSTVGAESGDHPIASVLTKASDDTGRATSIGRASSAEKSIGFTGHAKSGARAKTGNQKQESGVGKSEMLASRANSLTCDPTPARSAQMTMKFQANFVAGEKEHLKRDDWGKLDPKNPALFRRLHDLHEDNTLIPSYIHTRKPLSVEDVACPKTRRSIGVVLASNATTGVRKTTAVRKTATNSSKLGKADRLTPLEKKRVTLAESIESKRRKKRSSTKVEVIDPMEPLLYAQACTLLQVLQILQNEEEDSYGTAIASETSTEKEERERKREERARYVLNVLAKCTDHHVAVMAYHTLGTTHGIVNDLADWEIPAERKYGVEVAPVSSVEMGLAMLQENRVARQRVGVLRDRTLIGKTQKSKIVNGTASMNPIKSVMGLNLSKSLGNGNARAIAMSVGAGALAEATTTEGPEEEIVEKAKYTLIPHELIKSYMGQAPPRAEETVTDEPNKEAVSRNFMKRMNSRASATQVLCDMIADAHGDGENLSEKRATLQHMSTREALHDKEGHFSMSQTLGGVSRSLTRRGTATLSPEEEAAYFMKNITVGYDFDQKCMKSREAMLRGEDINSVGNVEAAKQEEILAAEAAKKAAEDALKEAAEVNSIAALKKKNPFEDETMVYSLDMMTTDEKLKLADQAIAADTTTTDEDRILDLLCHLEDLHIDPAFLLTEKMDRELELYSASTGTDTKVSMKKHGQVEEKPHNAIDEEEEDAIDRGEKRISTLGEEDRRPVFRAPAKPFRKLWRVRAQERASLNPETDPKVYAEFCEMARVLPQIQQVKKPSAKHLDAADHRLLDEDLLALSVLVQKRCMTLIDLSNNTLVTDKGVCGLLQKVSANGSVSLGTLRAIRLAGCSKIGDPAIMCLNRSLVKFSKLREISLSGLRNLSAGTLLQCARELGTTRLRRVNIADLALPRMLTYQIICLVLENHALEDLDVSWNLCDYQVLAMLRKTLKSHMTLAHLNLTNVTPDCSTHLDSNQMNIFIEGVGEYESLMSLDLSLNFLNKKSMIILETALFENNSIRYLRLCQNPLGAIGCRAMLRVLSRQDCLVEEIELYGMREGPRLLTQKQKEDEEDVLRISSPTPEQYEKQMEKMGAKIDMYNLKWSSPQGRYRLDLSDAGGRAILVQVLILKDKFEKAIGPDSVRIDGLPSDFYEKYAKRGANGVWKLNETFVRIGLVANTYPPESPEFVAEMKNVNKEDLQYKVGFQFVFTVPINEGKNETGTMMLERIQEATKLRCSYDFDVHIAKFWVQLRSKGTQADQRLLLEALPVDFRISYRVLSYLIRFSSDLRHKITFKLFGALDGTSQYMFRLITLLELPMLADVIKISAYAKNVITFCPDNCTGSYFIDLENCCDRRVASNVLLINSWDVALMKANTRNSRFGPPKYYPSPHNSEAYIRNEKINGYNFVMNSMFSLPRFGIFEFDYMTPHRPPVGTQPISDARCDAMFHAMLGGNCPLSDCKSALQPLSGRVYLTCRQLRRLSLIFVNDVKMKFDIVMMFCTRCVDWYLKEKIVRASFEPISYRDQMRTRAGAMFTFPYVQPENYRFRMDFKYHEDRVALNALMMYQQEETGDNIPRSSIFFDRDYDGINDELPTGIPLLWFTDWPERGIFECTYHCSPDAVNIATRLRLANELGYWNTRESIEDDEREIEWWMTLYESSKAFMEMGFVLLHNFDGAASAYNFLNKLKLKAPQGISKDIWMSRFRQLGVSSANEQRKVEEVYNFFDKDNSRFVTWREFQIVSDLWNELALGLQEFVLFLQVRISIVKLAEQRRMTKKELVERNAGQFAKALRMTLQGAMSGKSEIPQNAISADAGSAAPTSRGRPSVSRPADMTMALSRPGVGDVDQGVGPEESVNVNATLSPARAIANAKFDQSSALGGKSLAVGARSLAVGARKADNSDPFEMDHSRMTHSSSHHAQIRDTPREPPTKEVASASNFVDNNTFELLDLEGVFEWMDADGSGAISRREIAKMIVKFDYKLPNRDVICNFLDGVGEDISALEFIDAIERIKILIQKSAVDGSVRRNLEPPKTNTNRRCGGVVTTAESRIMECALPYNTTDDVDDELGQSAGRRESIDDRGSDDLTDDGEGGDDRGYDTDADKDHPECIHTKEDPTESDPRGMRRSITTDQLDGSRQATGEIDTRTTDGTSFASSSDGGVVRRLPPSTSRGDVIPLEEITSPAEAALGASRGSFLAPGVEESYNYQWNSSSFGITSVASINGPKSEAAGPLRSSRVSESATATSGTGKLSSAATGNKRNSRWIIISPVNQHAKDATPPNTSSEDEGVVKTFQRQYSKNAQSKMDDATSYPFRLH